MDRVQFQTLTWEGHDYEDPDTGETHFRVYAFGRTEDGKSVCVKFSIWSNRGWQECLRQVSIQAILLPRIQHEQGFTKRHPSHDPEDALRKGAQTWKQGGTPSM